jgi:hypothetical protein
MLTADQQDIRSRFRTRRCLRSRSRVFHPAEGQTSESPVLTDLRGNDPRVHRDSRLARSRPPRYMKRSAWLRDQRMSASPTPARIINGQVGAFQAVRATKATAVTAMAREELKAGSFSAAAGRPTATPPSCAEPPPRPRTLTARRRADGVHNRSLPQWTCYKVCTKMASDQRDERAHLFRIGGPALKSSVFRPAFRANDRSMHEREA